MNISKLRRGHATALAYVPFVFCASLLNAQDDPNFEVSTTRISASDTMVDMPMPPRPDGSKDQWPRWELREVDENVYSFRGGLHRSMVVVTTGGIVVVDPMRVWSVEQMLNELGELSDQPVTHVIYTHNHLDHIRGSVALENSGAQFIAHELAAQEIGRFPHPEVVNPDTVWGGATYEFTVGDQPFELFYLGPNHGTGMTFVGLPDRGIMYICDVISPGRLPPGLMPDFSPRGIEETLQALTRLDYEVIVNGHEHAAASSWDAITATLGFYRDVRVEVLAAMEMAGMDIAPWEMIRFVQRLPQYENWRYYQQWYPQVAGRVLMEEYLAW